MINKYCVQALNIWVVVKTRVFSRGGGGELSIKTFFENLDYFSFNTN